MPFYPIQSSFQGGELSPRIYGQVQSPFYKRGMEFLENFLCLPQGPIRMRHGGKHVTDANARHVRLIPFNLQEGQDYCAELGAGYLRVLNESGVLPIYGAELIYNNRFVAGSAGWAITTSKVSGDAASAGFDGSLSSAYFFVTYRIPGGIHAGTFVAIEQTLTVTAGDFLFQVAVPASSSFSMDITIGTTPGGSDILNLRNQWNTVISQALTGVAAGTLYIKFQTTSLAAGVLHDARAVDPQALPINPPDTGGGGTGPDLETVTGVIVAPSLRQLGAGSAVITGMPWTDDMLANIQFAQDVKQGLFLVHPNMPPQQVTLNVATGVFTVAAVAFTSPPTEWVAGNYPGVIELWQSRMWLAATPQEPTQIWASASFEYYDFTVPSPLTEASAFTLTLGTKGAIRWMRGKQSMLIGTALHEDIISSQNLVVSALDAQLVRQSAYGSGPIQAIDIGDQVLFVSRDFTKLRAENFNFDTQAWVAHDLAYFAEHITAEGINAVAFARDPDNTIYCVMSDGTMRMCTYDRLAEVVAWSRWNTAGRVISACVTADPGGSTTWIAVDRGPVTSIEVLLPYKKATAMFLDDWQLYPNFVYDSVNNTVSVQWASSWAGYTVGAVINGSWAGNAVADATGLLSWTWNGPPPINVFAGFPYLATARTLPLEGGVQYGTAQGLMKQHNKIFVRLIDSILPVINGQRPGDQRSPPTPMGDVEPSLLWDVFITNLGWDRYARVEVSQEIPFQTIIAAIFGKADGAQL